MKNKTRYIILAGVVILIVGAIFYLNGMKASVDSSSNNLENSQDGSQVKDTRDKPPLKEGKYPLAPELAGISGYLNTDEIKIADLEGKVVLVDFWTYTCINCIRTLPYLTLWDEKYRDKGLVIIGVHTPEFEFEKERENVQGAIDKYGIEYAVVQDNDYKTWSAYQNRFWPRKYLIDADGYIKYDHIGEGGYEETEMKIQELLAEIGEDANLDLTKENNEQRFQTTKELYAGSLDSLGRGQYIGNKDSQEVIADYVLPKNLDPNIIYLNGTWEHNLDNLHLVGSEGIIALEFTASEVNIVVNNENQNLEMEVLIDGDHVSQENAGYDVEFIDGKAVVKIDQARLYNVYKGEYGSFRLDLKVEKGFRFNAFTFG